jgi:hypothetical protein
MFTPATLLPLRRSQRSVVIGEEEEFGASAIFRFLFGVSRMLEKDASGRLSSSDVRGTGQARRARELDK